MTPSMTPTPILTPTAALHIAVYADGGVININPSPHGGTWACIFVDLATGPAPGGTIILTASGIVTPNDIGLPTVSNNLTELLACVEAMERLPDGWGGVIHTDSYVTLCRLANANPSFSGIPDHLRTRTWTARRRLGRFSVALLDGHPTRAQLAAGIGKRGNKVSAWNVACDKECGRLAAEWRAAHPEAAAIPTEQLVETSEARP